MEPQVANPAANANANRQHWNPKFMLGMLLGGGAAGAGTGLLVNLLHQRKAIMEDQEDQEDQALSIPLVRKQASGIVESALSWPGRVANALPGGGNASGSDRLGIWDYMGGVALPVGFIGGLQAVRGLHNTQRRHDLREQFAQEEKELERLLREEASKQAAAPGSLSTADIAMMGVLGLIPLTGLTSALLTNSYLNQTIPPNKPSMGPKPMRLRNPQDPESEENLKAASALWVLSATQLTKSADSGIKGLCGAAIQGALPEIENACLQHGAEHALQLSDKYAHVFDSEENQALKMASVVAVMESAMRGTACLLAASEFTENCPHLVKRAAAQTVPPFKLVALSAGFWKMAAAAALQQAGAATVAPTTWSALRRNQVSSLDGDAVALSNAGTKAEEKPQDPIDSIMIDPAQGLPA